MIPLAHWLVEKATEGHLLISATACSSNGSLEQCADDEDGVETQAASPEHAARLQQLEHALREAEDRLALTRQEHAKKEKVITNQLGEALVNRLALEITTAFRSLSQHLEGAVAEALTPFLETAVRDRAVESLADLILQEMRNQDKPVLEIRSPASLHEPLSGALSEVGVAVTICESKTIDVVFAGERLRFQDLALAWSAAITRDKT